MRLILKNFGRAKIPRGIIVLHSIAFLLLALLFRVDGSDNNVTEDQQGVFLQTRDEADMSSGAPQGNENQIYPKFKFSTDSLSAALPSPKYTVVTGSFLIPINDVLVPVVYALPYQDNHLARTAENLIFYGPYPGEKTKLNGNIVPNLVSRLGCSVFSFQFDGLGQSVSSLPYWSPQAGWFEAALNVRDLFIQKFGWKRQKLILFGYSGGAGMVMNFAGTYPDQIEAVAAQAPNVVPTGMPENKIKWLLVVNRGDTNRAVMKPFYAAQRSQNGSILYCETTPDRNRGHYHAPSGQTFDLIYSYLAGILDQRRQVAGGLDDLTRLWPYAAPTEPLHRYEIVRSSDLQPTDLDSGDFDLLPSLAFAYNWSRVCPPEQNLRAGSRGQRLIISFPAQAVPNGVVLYSADKSIQDIPREVEDINALAEHGYLVVSSMTSDPVDFADAATSWLKSQGKLSGLHVHLVANGPSGAAFISRIQARSDISYRSVSLFDFGHETYDSTALDGLASAASSCGMYGFYSYSDSTSDTTFANWASTFVTQGARNRGCFNFCAKPMNPPKSSEALRHTDAENEALSMVKSLIRRADIP